MPARRAVAILAFGALALVAACGGDDEEPRREPQAGVAPKIAGSAAQVASCRHWNRASESQRRETIRDIRGQLTPQGSTTARSPLSDRRAYRLFESACRPSYASELRLYKLYARAAAFEPLRPG